MSFSHLLILGIIAILVIPPEKLPEVARQFAKFLGEMRRMTSGLFDDLRRDVVLTPEDMKRQYEQRQQAQKQQQPENSIHKTENQASQTAQPAEPTPEEKKKAEDEYLKHIQGEAAVTSEETKNKNE